MNSLTMKECLSQETLPIWPNQVFNPLNHISRWIRHLKNLSIYAWKGANTYANFDIGEMGKKRTREWKREKQKASTCIIWSWVTFKTLGFTIIIGFYANIFLVKSLITHNWFYWFLPTPISFISTHKESYAYSWTRNVSQGYLIRYTVILKRGKNHRMI